MDDPNVERVIQLLDQAVSMQAVATRYLQEALEILKHPRSGAEIGQCNGHVPAAPLTDQNTLDVYWKGRTCNLRTRTLTRLLARLCRRPNFYVSHENLLQDVWQGARKSRSTIRSTVRRLKRRLRDEGMGDLACRIHCRAGRYGFMKEPPDEQIAQELHRNAP